MCLNCVEGIKSQAANNAEDKIHERTCEQIFIDENKSWSVLLTMCIGCKQDDINFPDVDSQLYKEHKNRNKIIPTTANTMRKEVIHRSIISSIRRRLPDQQDGQKKMP